MDAVERGNALGLTAYGVGKVGTAVSSKIEPTGIEAIDELYEWLHKQAIAHEGQDAELRHIAGAGDEAVGV